MGIEPTSSAWKAEVLPLNYPLMAPHLPALGLGSHEPAPSRVVEGVGFEPTKA